MKKKELKKALNSLARVRGLEREQHFKNGGTVHEWRGGLHTVTRNKKKHNNKRACRGKVRF